MNTEKATFAAGCFWGVESNFMKLPGVIQTRVGYIGGITEQPTYKMVCGGGTGHKEAVEVLYDPEKITYGQLLDAFWNMHNPTTRNRQGPDVGEQYHSVIFYHTDEQRATAEESKNKLQESGAHNGDIVTDITEAPTFYEAEEYHQQYHLKRSGGTCAV